MKKVLSFLKTNSTMSLATCTSNKPRSSIMEYIMVGDSILFSTSSDSTKAHNLSINNNLSFSVYSMPIFVTIDGTYVTPTDEEINEYSKILMNNHPDFPVEMFKTSSYYKVIPETVYYNDYTNGRSPVEIIKL